MDIVSKLAEAIATFDESKDNSQCSNECAYIDFFEFNCPNLLEDLNLD